MVAWGAEVPETGTTTSWKDSLPFKLEGEVEVGGQTISGNTGSPTLFEYRDLFGKPTIPHLRLKAEDKLTTKFLELGGTNMTRTDASYFLSSGQYNAFGFDFAYNRQPHIIGFNRTTIYTEVRDGQFTLPPPAQCGNVAVFNAVTTPPTQAQRDAVESSVNCLLQPTLLGHQTDTASIAFRYLPFADLGLSLTGSRMSKEGSRPIGGVIGSPGSNVTEKAAPRNERIYEVSVGAEYAKDWYQVRLNYTASIFENSIREVEWDNVCGTAPPPPATNCGNASGIGRLAMLPDNYAHTFSTAGGASLPWWYTRLTGTVSYNLWRQNQTFLPVSTLTTRNFSDSGATSPDAKMNVLLTNLAVTSRPLRDVTLTARYRYYHLDNDTPVQTFTSVVLPGDTGTAETKSNMPMSFRKQNTSAEVAWRLNSKLTAKAGYEWEHWGRSFREAAEIDEHIAKAAIDYRPLRWLLGRFTYSHGVRTLGADGYVQVSPITAAVLPQFRKFDQADRTRDKGEFFVQANPIDTMTVSGSFFAQQDHYFNTSYGLQESKAYGYSGDFAWTPSERVSLFGGYAHDDYQASQRNCRIPTGLPCDSLGRDDFFAKPRDILDTWHAGMNLVAVPQVLDLSLEYRYTFARSKYGMSGVPGQSVATAEEPASMPEIKNVFHVVNASARYHVTSQWMLRLVYLYERYQETDFTVDNITPSLANVTVDGFTPVTAGNVRSVLIPIQHQAFEAHFVGFSVGYKF